MLQSHPAQRNRIRTEWRKSCNTSRPADPPFCRVDFTKTPKAHLGKCLPLLQVAFLRAHGGAGGGSGDPATVQAERRPWTTPSWQQPPRRSFSARKGRGAPARPDDGRTEIGPGARRRSTHAGQVCVAARHVPTATGSGQEVDGVRGDGPIEYQETAAGHHGGLAKSQGGGKLHESLRQTLLGVVWMELEARLKRAETEQPTMDAMLKSGLATMTANQPQWKYVTWSPEKGTHIPPPKRSR